MEDPYEILGVHREATTVEIRKAYKRMALMHHPDKVPETERVEAEVRFKVISEAYETLSDPEKRAHYDRFGADVPPPGWQDYYDPGFGPDAFAEFFGFSSPQPHARKSPSTSFDVDISLEDAYRGRVLKLSSSRQVICKTCNGSGGKPKAKPKTCSKCQGSGMIERLRPLGHGLMTASRVPCDTCNGKGSLYRSKDLCKRCGGKFTIDEKSVLEVHVPRGCASGHEIIFAGKADEQVGQETGDINVTVKVTPHPKFERKGDDLYTTAHISLRESMTGFSRTLVTSLDGRELKVTVARGTVTAPYSILKIRGEGMVTKSNTGNLYVEILVDFPKTLDPALVDKIGQALPFDELHSPTGEEHEVDHEIVSKVPEYKDQPRPNSKPDQSRQQEQCPTM